jgi:ElaB/YqjD/DUF883 family membrane-anchored ribosome-binding protein
LCARELNRSPIEKNQEHIFMAKDRMTRAAELAEEARDRAEEAYEAAHAAIEDGIDDAHRYLKRQWKERPVAVTASAVGVGVLIGLLLGSRR